MLVIQKPFGKFKERKEEAVNNNVVFVYALWLSKRKTKSGKKKKRR